MWIPHSGNNAVSFTTCFKHSLPRVPEEGIQGGFWASSLNLNLTQCYWMAFPAGKIELVFQLPFNKGVGSLEICDLEERHLPMMHRSSWLMFVKPTKSALHSCSPAPSEERLICLVQAPKSLNHQNKGQEKDLLFPSLRLSQWPFSLPNSGGRSRDYASETGLTT